MPLRIKQLIFILSFFLMTSAAQSASSLVGTWVQESQGTRWTFRADGSGFMEMVQTKTTARFNWSLSQDGQTLRVSTAGTSVPYKVVQNDGSSLVIVNQRVSQTYQLRRE